MVKRKRTIKELLILLHKAVREDKHFDGMCITLAHISQEYDKKRKKGDIFSAKESDRILKYMDQYRPSTPYIKARYREGCGWMYLGYWYEQTEKEPRYRWLRTHIKLN